MIFAYIFTLSSLITFCTDMLYGNALSKHLIVFMMQVTECKCSVPILKYYLRVTGCSLCPHAMFSQAWSHMVSLHEDDDQNY